MRKIAKRPIANKRLSSLAFVLAFASIAVALWHPEQAEAIGESTAVDIRAVSLAPDDEDARPTARRRLAWEVRQRTSVTARLDPSRVRLDDPALFDSPFIYFSGAAAFDARSDREVEGLRRFLLSGGMLVVDPTGENDEGFLRSVRRLLGRALPAHPLRTIPDTHTVYRSFYLVRSPRGRIAPALPMEGIEVHGRMAVVLTRHDLGGAWARDNLGAWLHSVVPGGAVQREEAIRLGVNLVMYALCLDYKDDQVHAPFILRRRGQRP